MATRSALVVGFLVLGASTPVRYASASSAASGGIWSAGDEDASEYRSAGVAATAEAKSQSLETILITSDLDGRRAEASPRIVETLPTSSAFLSPAATSTDGLASVVAAAAKAPKAAACLNPDAAMASTAPGATGNGPDSGTAQSRSHTSSPTGDACLAVGGTEHGGAHAAAGTVPSPHSALAVQASEAVNEAMGGCTRGASPSPHRPAYTTPSAVPQRGAQEGSRAAAQSNSMMQGSDEHYISTRDASGGARPTREGHREFDYAPALPSSHAPADGTLLWWWALPAVVLVVGFACCAGVRCLLKGFHARATRAHIAAVRIQAASRGALVRWAMASMVAAAVHVQSWARQLLVAVALKDEVDELEEVVEALGHDDEWGFQSGSAAWPMPGEVYELRAAREMLEWARPFVRRVQAAIGIQVAARGLLVRVRADTARTLAAVSRIQAAACGLLVRESLRSVGELRGKCGGAVSAVLYLVVLCGTRLVDMVIFDRATRESVSMDTLRARYGLASKKATSAKQQRAQKAKKANFSGRAVVAARGQLYVVNGGNASRGGSVLPTAEARFLARSVQCGAMLASKDDEGSAGPEFDLADDDSSAGLLIELAKAASTRSRGGAA